MDNDNQLLLASAARLYSLGIDLEGARERLRGYVAQGLPWSSSTMIDAYNDFTQLKKQFDELETQHLELRKNIAAKFG